MARLVELYIDGGWVDITAGGYVLAEDPILISRGRGSESTQASPGRCTLTLYDPDKNGRWSNRVPGSPYYRKLGRNTPLRVTVDGDVRFVGEIATSSPRWDVTGARVTVAVEATGVLRRLTQGARALRRPATRAILAAGAVAYWPLDDGDDSTRAASALPGGAAMSLTGTLEFADVEGPLGQTRQPELLDAAGAYTGRLTGEVSYTDDSYWQIDVWVRGEPHSGLVNDQMNVIGFDVVDTAKFTRGEVNLVHDNGAGATQINVYFYDAAGNIATFLADSGYQTVDGDWHHIAVKLTQTGASTMDLELWADGTLVNSVIGIVTGDIGRIARVYTPGRVVDGSVNNFTSLSVADLAVYNNNSDPTDRYQGGIGYAGEAAGRRIERLCSEEGVTFASVGDLDDTQLCGPQTPETLLTNLEAAAVGDQGALIETRAALGLTYRTRVSMYNGVGPVLTYTDGLIAPPIEPDEDIDTTVWNDVSAHRPDGSSARVSLDVAVDPHHTLTTQAPPDGVGTYDRGPVDANVHTDEQPRLLASWIRHLGTWDELKYRQLTVEFAAPAWDSRAALAAEVAALDTGDRLRLDSLPAWLPPGEVVLQVQGTREVITPFTHGLTWNCTPGMPWEVWQMDTGGSTLAVARDTDDTSFKLATSAGPAWSTTAEPYYAQVAGEAVKVTAITTDTATFVGAGTAVHGNNASVQPDPHASTAAGDAMLLFAAIRNSGTGTVDLPSGWRSLANFGNARLMGRYYVDGTGADDPTVTFTGGVANADTSAQIATFRGLSLELDDGKYQRSAVSPNTLLNASAADIAYPVLTVRRDGCVVLVAAWKQDDFTSVAPSAGFTELAEASTTTGDDQSLYWQYVIQTSAADIAAGSLVVTGGAAAISRAIVLALRPTQTATVTRGINDASASPAAGDAVNGWRLGVLGL